MGGNKLTRTVTTAYPGTARHVMTPLCVATRQQVPEGAFLNSWGGTPWMPGVTRPKPVILGVSLRSKRTFRE